MLHQKAFVNAEHLADEEKENRDNSIPSFEDHYDDSSDEEDIDHAVAKYDVTKQFKRGHFAKELPSKSLLNHPILASFIARAAGLKLLYSPGVNRLYYPLKRFHLGNNSGLSATETVQLMLGDAFNHSVDYLLTQLNENHVLVKKRINSQELQQKIEAALNPIVTKFVSHESPALLNEMRHDLIHAFSEQLDEHMPLITSALQKVFSEFPWNPEHKEEVEQIKSHRDRKSNPKRSHQKLETVLKSFQTELKTQVEDVLKQLQRPTLPKYMRFSSSNPYTFLAHLRLDTRSQARLRKNRAHALFPSNAVIRNWNLTEPGHAQNDVIEVEEMGSTPVTDKDQVSGFSTYEQVYGVIKEMKDYAIARHHPIGDVELAEWIREIVQGTVPTLPFSRATNRQFIEQLQRIAYLFCGYEAKRNPAMHIITQMVLDLIIGENLTFAEALTGQVRGGKQEPVCLMPMVPAQAADVAYAVNASLQPFMPVHYGDQRTVEQKEQHETLTTKAFMQLEATIMREWFAATHPEIQSVTRADAPAWLLETIEHHFEDWFGPVPEPDLLDKPTAHYVEFHKYLAVILDDVSKKTLSPVDALFTLLDNKDLFLAQETGSPYCKVMWPSEFGLRQITIKGNTAHHTLDFYEGKKFLTLTFTKKELKVQTYPSKWQDSGIRDVVEHFKIYFNIEQIHWAKEIEWKEEPSRSAPTLAYSVEDFAAIMQRYQFDQTTYRINHVFVKAATQMGHNAFVFYMNWPYGRQLFCDLKVTFFRDEVFAPDKEGESIYSWFVSERKLYQYFPAYKPYAIDIGQRYYRLVVEEDHSHDDKKENTELISLWMTTDGQYGELHNLHRGHTLSGNDAIRIYQFFKRGLQIKNISICDESRLENANDTVRVPLRVIHAIVTGATWYQSKLPHLKLFECNGYRNPHDGRFIQNSIKLNKALKEVQSVTLDKVYAMFNDNNKRTLCELYKLHVDSGNASPATRRSVRHLVEDVAFNPLSDTDVTLQQLTALIYQDAKAKKTITRSLELLTNLLCDKDRKINVADSDYWLASRIHCLMHGGYFWMDHDTHHAKKFISQ